MKIDLFHRTFPEIPHTEGDNEGDDIVRAEAALVSPDDMQYKVILLDADDSFDVVIHYPDGEREIIWSLVKGPEQDDGNP